MATYLILGTYSNKGAKGLVLAAETAVGNYPLECVKFLKRCISAFKNKKKFL